MYNLYNPLSRCLNSISIHMLDGLSKRTVVPIAYGDTNFSALYVCSKAIVEGQRRTNLKAHRKSSSSNTGHSISILFSCLNQKKKHKLANQVITPLIKRHALLQTENDGKWCSLYPMKFGSNAKQSCMSHLTRNIVPSWNQTNTSPTFGKMKTKRKI